MKRILNMTILTGSFLTLALFAQTQHLDATTQASLPAGGEDFTLGCRIPGLPEGNNVTLIIREGEQRDTLARGTVTGGSFRLTGRVENPVLCELQIERMATENEEYTYRTYAEISLMVENVPMQVEASHFDSIPYGFTFGSDNLKAERNIRVTGGEAQREYQEYRDFMLPYEIVAKERHKEWVEYLDACRGKQAASTDTLKWREQARDAANLRTDEARREFIRLHPSYSISGYLMGDVLEKKFRYTDAQLDSIASLMAANRYKNRVESIGRLIDNYRNFTKGRMYTDFDVQQTDKTVARLSGFLRPGAYTMIDFWASWCGPCRASIPHVRELYKKYGDRLNILALSVDSKEPDWRRAMEQEKMEWTQLLVPRKAMNGVREAYSLSGIPYMLLISPKGEIIFAGHDSAELSELLEQLMD